MKSNRFNLRGIIILSILAMILITTGIMIFVFINFEMVEDLNTSLFDSPILWFSILTVILIVFFMSMMLVISKYIFDPIMEMKKAAEQIKSGNLNYPISYTYDNEIGNFCMEFDKMRIRLRDTILEQHEIEKRRKRLIASIAHDLRTPLTSITGYVEAIQDGIVKDQETYEKYLATIHEKANHLNHLIDDLSVYTKEELGEFSLNFERVNSGKVLNNYFMHKMDEFKWHKIDLVLHKPFISTFINVDPYRFNQIIENLIGNAQKYARSKIVVSTKVVNYHLQISITDDGEGIPSDTLQSIFDPFFMVNKVKDQREKRGSGLGLAIVKQLTESHNGTISVESQIGVGTTFILDFPLDR